MPAKLSAASGYDADLQKSLEKLFALQTFGIKLGLETTSKLLERFGNPHQKFPALHIAGTNGKGSVCAMIASVLQAAGLRVGLYTSPHLVDFRERIRINGEPISRERLALYTQEMLPVIEELGGTFFEGTTAMGFRYFAEEHVDIAVIETGMGGRLDSTNVLLPLATAVTSISLDHTRHLGDTLEEIAGEKAGIIKADTPAIVGRVRPRLRDVFLEKAREVGTSITFVDDLCRAIYHETTFDHTIASFMIEGREIPRLNINLPGKHQVENARVALAVLDAVAEQFDIDEVTLRSGFAEIRKNTGIRGRFESISSSPRAIIDVAHNEDGARVLVETLTAITGHRPRVRFVYGAVQDKNVTAVTELFAPLARSLYAVQADNPRSLPADEIVHAAQVHNIPAVLSGRVEQGMRQAFADAEPEDVVVICGSFFVVGEALATLEKQPPDYLQDTSLFQNDTPLPDSLPDIESSDEEFDIPENKGIEDGEQSIDGSESLQEPTNGHTPVKHWHATEQPRERLMKHGASVLSTAELIAILLRTGKQGEDVLQVSRNLLQRFESMSDLAGRDYRELQEVDGIGPTKAVTLAAAIELGNRIRSSDFHSRPVITSPEDVARIFIPKLRSMRKEQFHVIILNTANQILRTELVSEGSLNQSIVHPREVFRTAIVENAAAIIGLHNHPSGNPEPSKQDIDVTHRLVETGKTIGIPFHDHIIIAGEEYVSLAGLGYI